MAANPQMPKPPALLLVEHLSAEMHQMLMEEALEAEIGSAIDAAAEEGMQISRDDAIKILLEKDAQNSGTTSR